jgi:hypothetical protein
MDNGTNGGINLQVYANMGFIWDLYGIYMGFMIQNRDLPVNIQQKGQTMGNFPVRKMI